MIRRRLSTTIAVLAVATLTLQAGSAPQRARAGMVITQSDIASQIGFKVIQSGGNAVDAAVATAFAMAVTHPTAGNIGGGGFMVYRSASGDAMSYDFREVGPSRSSPEMWLTDGKYDFNKHHNSHLSVGVPGTVAGLHLAWKEQGSKPWKELVQPAIALARDGFEISHGLARSLAGALDDFQKYPASLAQFSKNGKPYEQGEILKQPDLAKTLTRIADQGPAGFYEGEVAALIEKEMKANGGLITMADLKAYQAKKRGIVKGSYRGYDIIGMPPPSSGGTAVIEMLNILEGFDLKANGYGSARNIHVITESMRRAFADRARYLADPDFEKEIPIPMLISKDYATQLRKTINPNHASKSSTSSFEFTYESPETTHISIVDGKRNAVSMTYTLESGYGSKIVVPGGGFLLNNEMGDFNAAPGLTDDRGLIGTSPNLARPGKRMLSSMAPTIISKDGQLFMVTGTPGGRTIINTVLTTILNVIDYGMNAQEAVDAGRMHHQWLPDRLSL
ncbi:MAG TPA: gamma-glutamyltransferase, partial [Vicinamibacterales bacterium]|nr:gamma-glutamyltransferase [Vicinamibacterales bacterium]